MVGVQGDPLVQHLPADAQLRVTALEELQGDRCHMGLLATLNITCSPQPPALSFWGTHPGASPTACSLRIPVLWRSGSGDLTPVAQE